MQSLRILAIDDEESLLTLLQRFLRQRGHQVTACSRAREALALCQQEPGQFDLAIADLTMPEMSGQELLAALLTTAPDLRILVCSGFPFDTTSLPLHQQRRVNSLQKPFLPNMLEEAIERLISTPAA